MDTVVLIELWTGDVQASDQLISDVWLGLYTHTHTHTHAHTGIHKNKTERLVDSEEEWIPLQHSCKTCELQTHAHCGNPGARGHVIQGEYHRVM